MHGHVFHRFSESDSSNQFSKTVEALGEYIAKTMKNSGDMTALTEDLTLPTIPEPGEPTTGDTSEFKKKVWRTKVKNYVAKSETLESNLKAV